MRAIIPLILLYFLSVTLVLADGSEFTLLTEDAPPTNYINEQSRLTGPSTEIVGEILNRLGWKSTIHVYPWARAYAMTIEGPKTVLFSTTRTTARESLFKWVGPIFEQRQILCKKAGSPLEITTLDDAKKVTAIGTYYNDTAEQFLKNVGFTNIESVPVDSLNIQKLIYGRTQLWATGDAAINTRILQAGFHPTDIEEAFVLQSMYLYIAFSKDTTDEMVNRWQEILDDIKKEGLYEKILRKYTVNKQAKQSLPP
ncbi:MAG TPA: transporter substrate-binding domain-containing protein [Desulfopila sp.]|nr:transporter substrate-binding domain-containing protein [Desulfopila sp.]